MTVVSVIDQAIHMVLMINTLQILHLHLHNQIVCLTHSLLGSKTFESLSLHILLLAQERLLKLLEIKFPSHLLIFLGNIFLFIILRWNVFGSPTEICLIHNPISVTSFAIRAICNRMHFRSLAMLFNLWHVSL